MTMTHAQRYVTLIALTKRVAKLDASYHAAFYLLATDKALFKKACPFVTVDGVDFSVMKRNCRDLDDQQKQLLSIAHNLFTWTSKCTVTPYDLSRLGYPALDYVCSALYIANGLVRVQVWENADGGPELKLDTSKYMQSKKIHEFVIDPLSFSQEREPRGLEHEP